MPRGGGDAAARSRGCCCTATRRGGCCCCCTGACAAARGCCGCCTTMAALRLPGWQRCCKAKTAALLHGGDGRIAARGRWRHCYTVSMATRLPGDSAVGATLRRTESTDGQSQQRRAVYRAKEALREVVVAASGGDDLHLLGRREPATQPCGR